MSVYHNTEGIVLAKQDRGEADRLLMVYTKDFGMVKLWAIGVRKITSKLRSGLELFDVSDIRFVEGKNKKIITDAYLIDGNWNMRKDLFVLKAAHAMAALMRRFVLLPEHDEKVWNLFLKAMGQLSSQHDIQKKYSSFRIQLLSILGYSKRAS